MRRTRAVSRPVGPERVPRGRDAAYDDVLVEASALAEMVEVLSLYRHGLRVGVTERTRSERARALLDRFGTFADHRRAGRDFPPAHSPAVETAAKSLHQVADALRNYLSGVEYVLPGRPGGTAAWPSDARWIACYAVAGENEGHYVHIDAIRTSERGAATVQQLLIIKVLTGRECALAVAAVCTRVLQAA